MKKRVRRLLAVVAVCVAAASASGCLSWFRGPNYYDLEIRASGDLTEKLQSLYVIVARVQDVEGKRDGAFLEQDALRSYTNYAQYKPLVGPDWELVSGGTNSDYIEFLVKKPSVRLRVNDDLVLGGTPHTVVVLAYYGTKGGFKFRKINEANLKNTVDQRCDVSDDLTLTTDR